MDFRELAERTGLGVRQLRYIVDYQVLAPRYYGKEDRAKTGHGVPREFSKFVSFSIALAAVLREAGLTRERVRSALDILFAWASPRAIAGAHAMLDAFVVFRSADALNIEIRDGVDLRVEAKAPRTKNARRKVPASSAWTNLDSGKVIQRKGTAMFVSRISLAELSRRVLA